MSAISADWEPEDLLEEEGGPLGGWQMLKRGDKGELLSRCS
jgi:hypothetical protein